MRDEPAVKGRGVSATAMQTTAMTRLRHDLNFVSSAGLILSGLTTGITGIVADLWDLNDFWYHTVSGYVMGAFAVLHLALNWNRMVGYAKFRLANFRSGRTAARSAQSATPAARRPNTEPEPVRPGYAVARAAVSRRGLFGLAIGGVGGLVLGRGLRPPPQIPAGSDVGVIYHQWSKPGVIDALGSVANWGQRSSSTRLIRTPTSSPCRSQSSRAAPRRPRRSRRADRSARTRLDR
jgi:hypothetical protein